MIALNKDLTKIWNNIVNSNAKIGRMDDPTSLEEKVNVPLTPFQINVYLFYRLYELLYSKFINDQLNLIDIIVSDYDIDNIVLAIYIYDMKKVGIHDNIKKITLEKLKVKQSELKDLPTLFEKIRAIVMEESSLSISSMRIFKKLSIDLMNRLHETINKLSLEDYLKELIKFIEKVLQETLISFYPEPKSVRFISQALRFFDNFDLISIWDIFHKFIPNIKNVLLFKYKDLYFSLSINRTLREDKTPSLELKINEEKNLNFKQFYRTYLETQLKKVYERENNSNVLSIDLEILIDFVFDLFNYDLPIEKVDFILILQKILFGIRNFENFWYVYPRPKIYDIWIRFLMKVIGLDLNFKKISHWNISEFLINLLISNFGLNSQIIVNLTNDQKNRNLSPTSKSLHLLFNNGSLAKLSAIDIQQADLINIDTIRTKFIDTGTYTPFFIFIDESLIKLFVDLFIIKFPKIGILKIMRLFKELQDPLKFRVYPPVPALDVLSKKSKYSLLKQVLAVFIDKHEF